MVSPEALVTGVNTVAFIKELSGVKDISGASSTNADEHNPVGGVHERVTIGISR